MKASLMVLLMYHFPLSCFAHDRNGLQSKISGLNPLS